MESDQRAIGIPPRETSTALIGIRIAIRWRLLAGKLECERFRPLLTKGLGYGDGAKGGRLGLRLRRDVHDAGGSGAA